MPINNAITRAAPKTKSSACPSLAPKDRESAPPSVTLRAAEDWDRLSLSEQRALISATIQRVVVNPGRGKDRITVELFS